MRFEIRAGGVFVILIGLGVLSGAVFFLGVMAGNEIAKQNSPDQSQVSSMFPLPSAPAAVPTPTTAPLAELNPPPAPAAAPALAAPALPPMPANSRAASVATARAPAPANTHAVASAATHAALAAPAPHKHPYNIQIEAVMDRDGADRMVRRLQALGYPAAAETTDIDGQLWYRVKVGPYDSQEQAQEAQDKLRAAYKEQYLKR